MREGGSQDKQMGLFQNESRLLHRMARLRTDFSRHTRSFLTPPRQREPRIGRVPSLAA